MGLGLAPILGELAIGCRALSAKAIGGELSPIVQIREGYLAEPELSELG